jgi:hypothetical protein
MIRYVSRKGRKDVFRKLDMETISPKIKSKELNILGQNHPYKVIIYLKP